VRPRTRRGSGGAGARLSGSAAEEDISIKVRADRPGPKISRTLWGVFFEDINFGAGGAIDISLERHSLTVLRIPAR
jgi:hypothetical protein